MLHGQAGWRPDASVEVQLPWLGGLDNLVTSPVPQCAPSLSRVTSELQTCASTTTGDATSVSSAGAGGGGSGCDSDATREALSSGVDSSVNSGVDAGADSGADSGSAAGADSGANASSAAGSAAPSRRTDTGGGAAGVTRASRSRPVTLLLAVSAKEPPSDQQQYRRGREHLHNGQPSLVVDRVGSCLRRAGCTRPAGEADAGV